MLITVILTSTHVSASSGNSYIFFFVGTDGELGEGTTYGIRIWLNAIGYTAYRYQNFTKSSILTMMGSCKTFHILTHGGAGFFWIGGNSGTYITHTEITNAYSSLAGLKFAFFEACQIGSTTTFQNALADLGVNSSLAFRENVSASTQSDGIHYFAERFYCYAYSGYSVYASVTYAKADTYNAYSNYYGCDKWRIYGYNVVL